MLSLGAESLHLRNTRTLLAPPVAHAAMAEVQATLDPPDVPLGESAGLEITVTGGQGSQGPRMPEIEGLRFQGIGQQTSMQITGGQVITAVTYRFAVTAEREGNYRIPPIAIDVGGKALATAPLTLRVYRGAPPPDAPGNAGGGSGTAVRDPATPVQLDLVIPDRELFVGELVPASLELRVLAGTRITEVTPPQVIGDAFTITGKTNEQPAQSQEVQNGSRWAILRWPIALSPVKAGEHPLSARLDVNQVVAARRGRGGNPFDDPFFDSLMGGREIRKVPVASAPRTVRVLALPDAGRPSDFTGAIGRFTIAANAAPARVQVGDPITMTVTVAGEGNFDRLEVPSLPNGGAWRSYDPTSRFEPGDKIGITGRKILEQAIVPQEPSLTEVPASRLSFFDPEARAYRTVSTDPIALAVAPALGGTAVSGAAPAANPGGANAPPGASPRPATEPPAPGPAELAPAAVSLGRLEPSLVPWSTRPAVWPLPLVPLIILWIGRASIRRRDRLAHDPVRARARAALRLLTSATEQLARACAGGDSRSFLVAARDALRQAVTPPGADGPTAAALTLADVIRLLPDDVSEPTRSIIREVFEAADRTEYSGSTLPVDALNALQGRVLAAVRELGEIR